MQEVPRQVSIYGLVDPRTECLRYIGKTVQTVSGRFAQHMCHRVRNRTKCSSWITNLQKMALRPEVVVLETSDEQNWREAEQFWIASLRLAGADLCNLADGGNGRSGYKLSDAHKAKIRESTLGRQHSAQARLRLSLAKTGQPRPDVSIRNALAAKLSFAQVADIRISTETGSSLARKYGVSRAMICLIRKNLRRVDPRTYEGVVS